MDSPRGSNRDIDMKHRRPSHGAPRFPPRAGSQNAGTSVSSTSSSISTSSPQCDPRQNGPLKRQIAQRLLDFAADRNKRVFRIVERRAVERGKLAQQLAGTQRLGTRKGRNGVERVLNRKWGRSGFVARAPRRGSKLGLQLELVNGKLRGNELGKTGRLAHTG